MRVLERLQLSEKILEKAGVMKEIQWLDQDGFLINRVSIAEMIPNIPQLLFTVLIYRARSCIHCQKIRFTWTTRSSITNNRATK